MDKELELEVQKLIDAGKSKTEIETYITNYVEAKKEQAPQKVDAPAEPESTASKPVDFLSESKSYKPFNPLDISGDLSLAIDPTGGVGAAVEMANSVVTDEEFEQIQINKKQKENEILAQDKADAAADGPLLFLDFSQELGGIIPGIEMTKKPEVRPTIDGRTRSAEGLPFVSDELDGYWDYTDRRLDHRENI